MPHRAIARSDRQQDRLDVLLLGAVFVFAFLASSFLENNSDFWSHLAAGRRLAGDGFSLRDILLPPRVFDLALYTLFRSAGGTALIVLKALGLTVLAWLLLPPRARLADTASLVACTLLALLALSPYASLRPALLSYFFLALTLRLLLAPQRREAASQSGRFFLLGPLFVLWVNLDRWFWLGPLLVLLFWIGERLEGLLAGAGRKPETMRRIPAWLPLTCGFFCLLNPLGIRVFSLPSTWLAQPWWLASPWQSGRFAASVQRMDLAALAYPVLMGLGLVSLTLPGVQERGRRALVWGSLAVLSSWHSALVPFFAVVAAPLTSLNWQDGLRRIGKTTQRTKRTQESLFPLVSSWPFGSFINRWVLLAGSLVLIFLAVVGGLHGMPRAETVPGWGVEADPSSRQFVETIHRWRQQAWLRPNDRLLVLPCDLAAYFCWFAPEEQLGEEQPHEFPALEAACRAGTENLVAVDDPNLLQKFAGDPEHWLLLHVEGRITLWGRKEACSDPSGPQPFAANRLVFASDEEDRALPSPPADSALQNYTLAGSLLNRLAPRSGPQGPDSEAATTYLRYFQARVLPLYHRNCLHSWSVYAAGLTAPPPPHALSLMLQLEQPSLPLRNVDNDLPALPLLAIRAARRALAVHPDDANAYLCLGQAYRFLWETTGERVRCQATSLLAELRQAQAAAALEQAALLDRDSQAAHQLLAELYQEHGYLDAALDHRREEVRLARRSGCRPGEDQRTFAKRLQRLEQRMSTLEGVVQKRQKRFASLPASVTQPRERAEAALHLGLARQALDDILLRSSPILLESSGVNLELELLLRLGRIEQLREWMQGQELKEHGENLGLHNLPAPALPGYPSSYRLAAAPWFRFLWSATQGDYALAQAQLRVLLDHLESARQERLRSVRRSLALTLADEILLSAQPELLLLQLLGHKDRVAATHLVNSWLSFNEAGADLSVLAGTLALERGWIRQAERDFEAALGIRPPVAGNHAEFAARPLAEFYLQLLRAAQGREYPVP